MARMEILLGVVLIALALLVGILFGGSSIWFLKPADGGGQVVEKIVNKYVCSDGVVKDTQSECPVTTIDSSGNSQVVCPPCKATGSSQTTTPISCTVCLAQCGSKIPGYTTTTLYIPPCKACSANSDCGESFYSEGLRCRNGQEYKIKNDPLCAKSCCNVVQTQDNTRQCVETETCNALKGCIPIPEDGQEKTTSISKDFKDPNWNKTSADVKN
jgi:hypothetical protein